MSDIKNLLEKMDAMSAAERKPTGPKWPGYLKGTDSAKKSRSRMVGDGAAESVEESESFLKELNKVINSNPVKRDLFQEWQEYKQQQEVNEGIEIHADPNDPTNIHGWEIIVPPGHIQGVDKRIQLKKYSGAWYDEVRKITGGYAPMSPTAEKMFQQLKQNLENNPYQPGSAKEFKPEEPKQPQDIMVPPADPRNPKGLRWPEWGENETPISEYGAPGSAIGNDTATNPAEQAQLRQQQNAQKQEIKNQVAALVAQLNAARAQISQLNKSFPQGANPVEKAMALRDIQAQKIGLQNQIEDLMSQIATLRRQAI
jgi:hypothetical protein